MSTETVRNRPGVRLSFGEAIAALALVATIFSISQAWWILPEKVTRVENEKQEARLQKIEAVAADRAETLARIDERTKRIEQILANRP
jgi:type I restriction-modification system DNA methylase subunit